jgi:hypothetical protein
LHDIRRTVATRMAVCCRIVIEAALNHQGGSSVASLASTTNRLTPTRSATRWRPGMTTCVRRWKAASPRS